MNCPRCTRGLQAVDLAGVTVDACHNGCGGVWLDLFELEKMDQPDESAGWLLQHMRIDLSLSIDFAQSIECPRCAIPAMRQLYQGNRNITIDKCLSCGGTWLDFGELFAIRSGNPPSAEHRGESGRLFRHLKGEAPSRDATAP